MSPNTPKLPWGGMGARLVLFSWEGKGKGRAEVSIFQLAEKYQAK